MSAVHPQHLYRGECPDELCPDMRDPDCLACHEMDATQNGSELLMQRIAELERRLAESEAGAAAMRKTLDDIADGQFPTPSHLEREGDEARDYRKMAQDALDACTAGADLMRELTALRLMETTMQRIADGDTGPGVRQMARVALAAVAEARKPR